MWLYLAGPGRDIWVYHAFSVVTGTLSIIIVGWVAARKGSKRSPSRMLVAMALVAVMYPFVNFGSEARGYAPMMVFALLAYGAIEPPDTLASKARWGYGLAGILGVLSHLSMLPILFALSVCFAIRQLLQGHTILHTVHATVRLNAPFVAGLLVFVLGISYGAHLRNDIIEIGGSTLRCLDTTCFTMALDEMTRFATGGFGENRPGLHSGLYVIAVGGCVAWLAAIGNRRALPLGLILLGVPLIFFVAGQPALPHGRYFFAVFIFVPLLLAEVVGELYRRNAPAKLLGGLVILGLLGANAWADKQFLNTGRGDYANALDYILENPADDPIAIGTEMIFQLRTVMNFTLHRTAPSRHIEYVKFKDIPDKKPKWLVSVSIHTQNLPDQTCTGGLKYSLVHGYGHWGMAGSTWGLYRLSSDPAPEGCLWLTDGRDN
jgi:hypothetical protein